MLIIKDAKQQHSLISNSVFFSNKKMFRSLLRIWRPAIIQKGSRLSHNITTTIDPKSDVSYKGLDSKLISNEESLTVTKHESKSTIEKCEEDISHVAPYLKPSFNFAAYVNKSETLQQLVHLGVDLHKLEKSRTEPPMYLLQLDFERDIKKYLMFLYDLGLDLESLGTFITKNPFIFREDLEDLRTRLNYLKFKKFDDNMILRIMKNNPSWLSISTQDIDEKLGFFQKTFGLTGNEVRALAVKRPKLITYDLKHVKLNLFVIKEEMGFSPDEIKKIILRTPDLLIKNQHSILETFEYFHKNMKISLETIALMPNILTCRASRIRQRHLFLEKLGLVQFDPTKPNYISPLRIVTGTDAEFATEVTGSSIQAFNIFLKSL